MERPKRRENVVQKKSTELFYAEVLKGYIIKVLFDVLGETFNRIEISITKKGIFCSRSDQKFSICYFVHLERDGFKNYKVTEDNVNISFDLSRLKKLLKNVKKKEKIIIKMIDHGDLFFDIRTGTQGGGITSKSEEISIKTQKVECMSNESRVESPSEDCYCDSVDIDSSDFQKIRKIQWNHDQNSCIRIVMQENNFLSISDSDETYSAKLTFGEVCEDMEFYDKNFDKGLFKRLAKIANLTQQIQFCCPKPEYQKYPLMIKAKIESMGTLKIFLKDDGQLEEESKVFSDDF